MRRTATIIMAAALAAASISPAMAKGARSAAEEANLAAVTAFYNAALNEKDADKALGYLGDEYIQHNPVAQNGPEGLRGFIGFLKSKFPENHSDIRHSYVDGDTVVLHVLTKRTPEARGNAVVDIFRLEKGKIVEHWDVQQEIPEKTASGNPML